MDTFINKLKVEFEDLGDKVKNLRSFIGSEKFDNLSPEEKSLLKLQLRQMEPYLSTLKTRLQFYCVLPGDEELSNALEEIEANE